MQTTAFALLYIHNLVIISYRLPSCTQFAIALHILILIVFFYMRSKNSISFLLECFKRSFATKSRLSSHENTKLSSNNLWSVTLRGSGERKINHEKIFPKSCSKIERLRGKRKKRNWNQGSCHWNLLNGFDFTVERRKFWLLIRFSLIADRFYAIHVTGYVCMMS